MRLVYVSSKAFNTAPDDRAKVADVMLLKYCSKYLPIARFTYQNIS